jgi:hypothetical protein
MIQKAGPSWNSREDGGSLNPPPRELRGPQRWRRDVTAGARLSTLPLGVLCIITRQSPVGDSSNLGDHAWQGSGQQGGAGPLRQTATGLAAGSWVNSNRASGYARCS